MSKLRSWKTSSLFNEGICREESSDDLEDFGSSISPKITSDFEVFI